MKKLISVAAMLIVALSFAQYSNILPGETLNYRIHYGILNAGTATLSTNTAKFGGKDVFHVKGVGKSTGAVRAVFKVDDLYESYINSLGQPLYYVRNVSEGGYRQHLETVFNHDNQTLVLTDKKNRNNPARTIKSVRGIQDMLSCFYTLRSQDSTQLRAGNVIKMNVWIDDNMFPFQLKILNAELLSTKFGKVNCLKITPAVISGRVFKASESVTMWVTNDRNYVPIMLKADLAVGSLKAELDSYKNVKYPIRFY